MHNLIEKFIQIFQKKSRPKKWQEIEYFDALWRSRIKLMSSYIPDGASVIDLGCGKMWLKEFIKNSVYYPVDYVWRGEGTIICDLNKDKFPDIKSDISFVSGCLEYIEDYKSFICNISNNSKKCILSYCTTDLIPDIKERKSLAWVNHLSRQEILDIFTEKSMQLVEENMFQLLNSIFVFSKISDTESRK